MAANGPDSELPTPTKPVPTVPKCAPSPATAKLVCSSEIIKNRQAAIERSFAMVCCLDKKYAGSTYCVNELSR